MAFDFKKEYKEFYMAKAAPNIVTVPPAAFVAVHGRGNPNEPGGAYQNAVSVLYSVAYTIKMSYRGDHRIDGFFEYVVPPLEGFWQQENTKSGIDYNRKSDFIWTSVIRLPDFVTPAVLSWAKEEATVKKKLDCSIAQYLTVTEGLCVQAMHIGPYDDEPATVALMDKYIGEKGYKTDINEKRLHHEIYLSDARRTLPEKLKTVIRQPIAPL